MACEVTSVIGMLCAAVPDLPIYLSQTLHFALREIMDCGARGGLAKGLGKTVLHDSVKAQWQ